MLKLLLDDKEISLSNLPKNITLDVQGNSTIILYSFKGNGNLSIIARGNNTIYFGKDNIIEKGTVRIIANNFTNRISEGTCKVGERNKFRGNLFIYLPTGKDKRVEIGNDNLFAANSEIVACLEHPVFIDGDLSNKEDNVTIGNHNWIGRDVLFMTKGGVQNDSVVGIRSLVTKKFNKSNIVVAGNPAKIKKENIDWDEVL